MEAVAEGYLYRATNTSRIGCISKQGIHGAESTDIEIASAHGVMQLFIFLAAGNSLQRLFIQLIDTHRFRDFLALEIQRFARTDIDVIFVFWQFTGLNLFQNIVPNLTLDTFSGNEPAHIAVHAMLAGTVAGVRVTVRVSVPDIEKEKDIMLFVDRIAKRSHYAASSLLLLVVSPFASFSDLRSCASRMYLSRC